jgi:hypothetical protein
LSRREIKTAAGEAERGNGGDGGALKKKVKGFGIVFQRRKTKSQNRRFFRGSGRGEPSKPATNGASD